MHTNLDNTIKQDDTYDSTVKCVIIQTIENNNDKLINLTNTHARTDAPAHAHIVTHTQTQ